MVSIPNHEDGACNQEANVMARVRTLRGQITGNAIKTALNYEGTDLTKGWKILSITVCDSISPVSGTSDGVVMHTDDVQKTRFSLTDNQTIGFAGRGAGNEFEVVDPNHIIVNDLYLSNLDSSAATYMIELTEVKIDPTFNIIYQLKERAQGALE
jgi:hypothetical protein